MRQRTLAVTALLSAALFASCSAPPEGKRGAPEPSSGDGADAERVRPRPEPVAEVRPPREPDRARSIGDIEATGLAGGLVVIIEGDGSIATSLGEKGPYLVDVICAEPARVEAARERIRQSGDYGEVSADAFDGVHLPYTDNLVNVIADRRAEVPAAHRPAFVRDVIRVLAPRGVYLAENDLEFPASSGAAASGRVRYVKPVPAGIDEWSHFLHGPGNNAVANDTVVGPPRYAQWVGGPRYGRHHDKMSSLSAAVTAGGRVYYINDEAPPFSVLTAPEWRLVARDAFNGTILWKRDIEKWHDDLFPYKSGPAHLARKLVADGERVFVVPSIGGPAVALDAATGRQLISYDKAGPAVELLYSRGVLFVGNEAALHALDARSGDLLWKSSDAPVRGSIAVDDRHAVFLVGDRVVCLDRRSGAERWRSEPVPRPAEYHVRFDPTLVLYKDVVLFAGGEKSVGHQDHQGNYSWFVDKNDTVEALSAETGRKLWDAPHPLSGYASSEDLFVIDDVVWCGETTSGHAVGHYAGYDVHTGEVVREFDPDVKTYWFHHRCHRGKATVKYIMPSRTGIEYIDPKTGHWQFTHWTRGACLYGIMPANGLIYAPQNPCACFLENRTVGFAALRHEEAPVPELAGDARLVKGAAAGPSDAARVVFPTDSWPTYRCDNARSGSTRSAVPASLGRRWTAEVGGRLSALTAAAGRVFVCSIDRHEVLALNEEDGSIVWRHTAGARVDSPPTVYASPEGGAFCAFGSRDGTITSLRASDGALSWRFRAAPADRRLMAFEQIESVWPVNGSVLVHDGVLYAVAGRSMFLDGGLRLVRLDPATGRLLSETVLDDRDDAGDDLQKYARQHNMPATLPDILSCDGKHVFMRSQPFTLEGKRLPLEALEYAGNPERYSIKATQDPEFAHLFSPAGLLDDTWWHRTYWVYGSRFTGGWAGYPLAGKVAPSGRILVFDEDRVYGYGRLAKYYRWTKPIEHRLFASVKTGYEVADGKSYKWQRSIGMHPRGMVKAGDTLFIAGAEDLVDEQAAFRQRNAPEWKDRIARQAEAMAGRGGGLLRAIDAETGERLSELKTLSIPVFDGMAAAGGRLYMSCVDGTVMCLAGEEIAGAGTEPPSGPTISGFAEAAE